MEQFIPIIYNMVKLVCCNFNSFISHILYLMFILAQSLSLNPKNRSESVSLVSRLSDYVISDIVAVMILIETFTFT